MLNQVVLFGRLTKEPLSRGENVVGFSIAFDNVMKDKDGNRGTSFIDCTAFKTTAEIVSKYAHKGDKVAVVGSLNQRRWTSKDGKDGSAIEVIVDSIELLEPKKQEPEAPNPDEVMGEPVYDEKPPLADGWEYGPDGKPRKIQAPKKK